MKNLIHSCVMMETLVPSTKASFQKGNSFFRYSFFFYFLELPSKGEEASLTLPWLIGMFYNWTLFIHRNRRLWYCACSHQHVVTITITDLPLLHHDSYYTIAIVNVFKTIVQLYLFFFVFFLQFYNTLFLL